MGIKLRCSRKGGDTYWLCLMYLNDDCVVIMASHRVYIDFKWNLFSGHHVFFFFRERKENHEIKFRKQFAICANWNLISFFSILRIPDARALLPRFEARSSISEERQIKSVKKNSSRNDSILYGTVAWRFV